MRTALFSIIAVFFFSGCIEEKYVPRALEPPPIEVPVANIPKSLRVSNWLGNAREGSCVHATTKNCLVWMNDPEGAASWPYENGEYASQLKERLKKRGYDFEATDNANYQLLEWATSQRLPAIIWWKPSHCCMFAGFASGRDIIANYPDVASKIDPSKQYAAILDNNYVNRIEFEEKSQFIRLWIGYGGFGCVILKSPTTSIPYKSYELIKDRS